MARAPVHVFLLTLLGTALAQQPNTWRAEGRVVDMLGEPLGAVPVQVTDWNEPDRVLAAGMTDASGCFLLADVPFADTWGIGAIAPARTPTRVWARPGRGLVVIRVPESVRVTGTLRDRAGQPVAGATVAASVAFARKLQGARDLAVTDQDGRFVLRHAPMGFLCLTAVIPGDGLCMVTNYAPTDATIDLAAPTWSTHDAVIQLEGIPAEGLPARSVVSVQPTNVACRELPPPWQQLVPDERGRCTLHKLPEWTFVVTPSIPGLVCEPRSRNLGPGDQELKFRLIPAVAAELQWSGTLRDARERPVGGAALELRAVNTAQRVQATTDTEGRWAFRLPVAPDSTLEIRLVPGDFVLDTEVVGGGMASVMDPQAASRFRGKAEPGTPLALRAVASAMVAGTAELPDGQPARLANVRLEAFHATRMPSWMPVARDATDLAGRFQIRGVHPLADTLRIVVEDARGTAVSPEFTLQEPGAKVELAPMRMAASGTIEGSVRDHEGKPLAGVRVWLREWEGTTRRQRTGSVVEVLTDRRGQFRFVGVAPGGARLQLAFTEEMPKLFATEPFEVAAGEVSSVPLIYSGQ